MQDVSHHGAVQLVIDDVLDLSLNFSACSFKFCFREMNEVAHRLAKLAVVSICNEVWLEDALVADLPLLPF